MPEDTPKPLGASEPGQPQREHRRRSRGMLIGLLLLGIVYLLTTRPHTPPHGWGTDFAGALETARASDRTVLVEFYTQGCPACRWMEQEVLPSRRVQEATRGYVLVRIDGEVERNLRDRYQVEGYPTLMLLSPDGGVLSRAMGALTADELIAFLAARPVPGATGPAGT